MEPNWQSSSNQLSVLKNMHGRSNRSSRQWRNISITAFSYISLFVAGISMPLWHKFFSGCFSSSRFHVNLIVHFLLEFHKGNGFYMLVFHCLLSRVGEMYFVRNICSRKNLRLKKNVEYLDISLDWAESIDLILLHLNNFIGFFM